MPALTARVRSTTLSWLVIGVLGALEGLYGRTRYLGDWLSYLNVSRCVSNLDWKGIFDPMWSPGYPMLVALARAIFPLTAVGEWYAIFWLNWIIFLCAYAAWRYLLRRATDYYDPSLALADNPSVVWISCGIFLSFGLCFDRVSRVSPDLMVSTLFILAAAETLRLLKRPTVVHAIALGAVLGAGYWVKGVFLSFAAIFLLTLFLSHFVRKTSWRIPLTATAASLALILPFIAAISWSYGQFTLGASGSLNYAFHVNHLPHWTNWQGGPPQFGTPIHPTQKLLTDLPVFAFAEPFHSTYPPYNNMAYWYQGFRHFFSFRDEALAIGRSLYFFAWVVLLHPILYALGIALLVIILRADWRHSFQGVTFRLWPLFLPAFLSTATYLLVHVEDRYLGSFLMILSLLPFAALLDGKLKSARVLAVILVCVYTLGTAAELTMNAGHTFKDAADRVDFRNDSQWKVADALRSNRIMSGDKVALIGNGMPDYLCTWAYISGIRIVAEFGSIPWHLEPWDRTHFDRHPYEQADKDYGLVFWNLPPAERQRVLQKFHDAGARAVVSLSSPGSNPDTGWYALGDSGAWIYKFDDSDAASAKLIGPAAQFKTTP